MKMSPEDVTEVVNHEQPLDVLPYMLEFEQPEGWDYYDDLIPKMYDHMENKGMFGFTRSQQHEFGVSRSTPTVFGSV